MKNIGFYWDKIFRDPEIPVSQYRNLYCFRYNQKFLLRVPDDQLDMESEGTLNMSSNYYHHITGLLIMLLLRFLKEN